jgi:hypothetical protein
MRSLCSAIMMLVRVDGKCLYLKVLLIAALTILGPLDGRSS